MFAEMTRSVAEVRKVELLRAQGLSDYEIARRSGVPRSTVNRWGRVGLPARQRMHGGLAAACATCGQGHQGVHELPGGPYAYLLGQYLGDGTISRNGRSGRGHVLRIFSDALYPGVIRECCVAIGQLLKVDCTAGDTRGRPCGS
jgi:hypothetical protein